MSSTGNLATGDYTATAVTIAEEHSVLSLDSSQLIQPHDQGHQSIQHLFRQHLELKRKVFERSVKLLDKSCKRELESVINERDSDIIIVGCGIIKVADSAETAREYRLQGWDAYLAKCS
ncbi:hypothetical protein QYF36_010977 [Acer negundo]|nr:hypothetical protein QYF36_010977 [Acer negundo]